MILVIKIADSSSAVFSLPSLEAKQDTAGQSKTVMIILEHGGNPVDYIYSPATYYYRGKQRLYLIME